MKIKRDNLILILTTALILFLIFSGILFFKNLDSKNENKNLQLSLERWMIDRNLAIAEMESCQEDKDNLMVQLSMLTDDVAKLKKSCIKDNECAGHYPNIRWICNIDGNAVDDGDRICFCNENCNLQFE